MLPADHNRRYRAYKTEWQRAHRAGNYETQERSYAMTLDEIAAVLGTSKLTIDVEQRNAIRKLWRGSRE
jgi:DNA-binding CsgD family transcriptional regulator